MNTISISFAASVAMLLVWSCADSGEHADEATELASVSTEQNTSSLEGGFGIPTSLHCDKVTTFVCPGDGCLCKQKNCHPTLHDGDFVPCGGPPVAGCEHDFSQQFCYPAGQPINCGPSGVPVNRCGYPCRSGGVTYTSEPNGCCRGERKCENPRAPEPQPIDETDPQPIDGTPKGEPAEGEDCGGN